MKKHVRMCNKICYAAADEDVKRGVVVLKDGPRAQGLL
jgi:hypothetical protein